MKRKEEKREEIKEKKTAQEKLKEKEREETKKKLEQWKVCLYLFLKNNCIKFLLGNHVNFTAIPVNTQASKR